MFLRRAVKLIKREGDRRDYEEENLTRNTKNNHTQLIEWAQNRWGIEYTKMDLFLNGDAYRAEQKKWEDKYGRA